MGMDGIGGSSAFEGLDNSAWSLDEISNSAVENLQSASESELSQLFGGNDGFIDSTQWSPVDTSGWGNSGVDFSSPGSIGSPDAGQADSVGYSKGTSQGPEDTGALGQDDRDLNDMIQNGSLEEKIFALMLKMAKTKEGELEASVNKADKNMASRKGSGAQGAESKGSEQRDMFELQKVQGELSAINSLTTNMLNTFKQMRDGVIQNIR